VLQVERVCSVRWVGFPLSDCNALSKHGIKQTYQSRMVLMQITQSGHMIQNKHLKTMASTQFDSVKVSGAFNLKPFINQAGHL